MVAARSRPHPPGGGTGARAQISRRRGTARELLQPQAMTLRRILLALTAAATLGAQTFIQMSDPQFGMFTKDAGFEHETANFEFAIAAANRLKPAFVVITGDLTNKAGDAAQIAEFHRIAKKLDPKVKLFAVTGNHDVANEPTADTLAAYRKNFGPDH